MKNFLKIFVPSALFLLTIFVVGTNMSKPFWGEHDWNGARYGNIAKNYVRYGYLATKFGQVENGGLTSPNNFIFYTHFQPLLPVLISLSYHNLGISEYATRVVPLLATAGFIVALYFIGFELFGRWGGVFSSLFALATPMVRYYGKNPVHEPLALFFASLSFLGAILFTKRKKYFWLIVTGFVLTALTNWSFAFLLAGLTVFLFEKRFKNVLIPLWLIGILLAALHFLHIYLLTGSFLGGGLSGAFLERTSVDQVLAKFGPIDYILRIRLWASTLFTNTLLVASLIGLVFMTRSKLNVLRKFILSIFIFCIYPVFFANASFVHSYFIYYFTLPLALLSGYFAARLISYKKVLVIIALGILIGIWLERASYLKALDESSGDKFAVEIAKTVESETKPGDLVLIEPFEYTFSRMPILSFYSNRNIVSKEDADWKVEVSGNKYEITKISKK